MKGLRGKLLPVSYIQKPIALLFCLFAFIQFSFAQTDTPVSVAEAESGMLTGVNVAKTTAGYSGTGYVTGLDKATDKVTVTVNVPVKGFYKLVIRYNSLSGEKTQYVIINNGGASSVVFPKTTNWTDIDGGKYLLNAGANTITVQSSWGWMDIDKFTIYNATKNVYHITTELVNPNSTAETKSLYQFLLSKFNAKIISGQTDSHYPEVKTLSGKSAMIRGYDFQHFTQGYAYLWKNGAHSFGWHDDGSVKKAIDWYNSTGKKGIVTFQWHWHSPSGGIAGTNTFYTKETTFDVTKAVISGTVENALILRDIDSIATQLGKFRAAGVPVLWRPLHEAGGAWFWWGAKGPKACKDLFYILYDRLINHHRLNNLIWVWSTPETDWYPGNDFIDIVGHDSYPGVHNYDIQKNSFDRLFTLTQGTKLIAMTENGPIPDPDDCLALDAPWAYFMSWSDLVTAQNSNEHIKEVFNDPDVLTLENPTALNEIKDRLAPVYRLFPNPAMNKATIEGPLFDRLEVLNLKGNVVFATAEPVSFIPTARLANGIYFVKFYNKHTTSAQKLVVSN
ncbi:MAG TPA: glycosyl hydrolase [Prolixibacteraceae bacterium]|nr:glycosyl hydrolase [Prolixibacteraceae bacterium]